MTIRTADFGLSKTTMAQHQEMGLVTGGWAMISATFKRRRIMLPLTLPQTFLLSLKRTDHMSLNVPGKALVSSSMEQVLMTPIVML